MLGKILKWVAENKAKIGWALGGVAAGLSQLGYTGVATVVSYLAAALMGAGHFPSDREVRKNGDTLPPQG